MRRLLMGGVIALASAGALTLTTAPAQADWHEGHGWHRWHHGHWAPPPPRYYYPPRAYYAPPPVYYAPPPAYYAPPPVYYGAPGASITLSFP